MRSVYENIAIVPSYIALAGFFLRDRYTRSVPGAGALCPSQHTSLLGNLCLISNPPKAPRGPGTQISGLWFKQSVLFLLIHYTYLLSAVPWPVLMPFLVVLM